MRLTHIKLAGFKSFVDPTTLHVPGQLVAVMGPNGCGKSNVIDAVRWVLGEASAKQLRGESMQDVIFNGATTRKAVSRASVELVFDNSDNRLQGAWGQYNDIAIKRTLTRQGQSQYYINNQVVRRRDITDLFLGTGVGARGYAVIEQGMISRIIEARPEELRAHIEEAAGVSKYKERRKETATRLKDTTEHLQRLADIQSELTVHIDKLALQAQTAEQYQDIAHQLKQHQNHLDFVRWREADEAYQQAQMAQQHLQSQLEATEMQAQTLAQKAYQTQVDEQLAQQRLHTLTEQRANVREQAARLETQIQHWQHNHERVQLEQQQANEQLQGLELERMQLQEQLEEAALASEQVQLSHEQWQLQLEHLHESQPEQQERLDALQLAWQHQQDTHYRLERESAVLQQQSQNAQRRQQECVQQQTTLQQEGQALAMPEPEVLQAAQERVALLQTQVNDAETAMVQCEQASEPLQAALEQAQQHSGQCQQTLISAQAAQKTIAALLPKEMTDGVWQGDEAILWQHIQVDEPWRHAVQMLLRERQFTRSHAPQNMAQTGQSLSWLCEKPHNAAVVLPDSLAKKIQSSSEFAPAVAQWFGRIRCVDSLDSALTQQKGLQADEAFITEQAQWVDAVSVQCLHTQHEPLLQHQAQLQALTSQIASAQPQYEQAQHDVAHLKQQIQWQQQAFKQAQTQHKQLHEQLRLAHTEATKLLERAQQTQLRHNHIQQQRQQLAHTLVQLTQECAASEQQQQQLQEAAATLSDNLAQLSLEREQQQQQHKHLQLQILEGQRQQGLVALERQKNQQHTLHVQQRLQQLQQQQQHWLERQHTLALQSDSDEDMALWQTQWAEHMANIQLWDEDIQTQQQQSQEHAQLRQQIQQTQQQLDAQLPQLRAQLQQQLLLQQQAQLNQERFLEQLQQRDGKLADWINVPAPNLKTLQHSIVQLTAQLQALGPVNLAALEELSQARERFDYYQRQRDDVEKAMALLGDAMAQIDTETKNLFEQTFHAVNEHMQAFFPTLFGGGHAHLTLVGDNMLEAGVTIMAQPPGKKNTTIHLLSGGEKALTAMSLVFALFSLNPAPFCLLDEVDAPLDDANTARFCKLVEKMSEQTQFLYISHNRLTMEMAEQLIGVTMQEQGVSRIVEVDIQQAMALAEQTV